MSAKVQYTKALQEEFVDVLARAMDIAAELENIYFDETYNSGGADAIADADIASTGLTATQVGSMITCLQQFRNFVGNSAVTTGDYASTINTTRSNLPGSNRTYR